MGTMTMQKGSINNAKFVKLVVFEDMPANKAIVEAGSKATTKDSRKQMGYQYRQRNLALIRRAEAIKRRHTTAARSEFVQYLRERHLKQ